MPARTVRRPGMAPLERAASSCRGEGASWGTSYGQIAGIQRSRLLSAAVQTVDELGYEHTTVAHITRRARVSRRTFYELFHNREECLLAVLEEAVQLIRGQIAHASSEGLPWRERVRGGLGMILAFFDREPALARVCFVQSTRGGPAVLARREQLLADLVAVVDAGRRDGARDRGCTPLTAEGLVGAVYAIIQARLLRGEHEPLAGLLGELMGMIVLPYQGAAAARREQTRSVRAPLVGGAYQLAEVTPAAGRDPLDGVSMRLTYRTARVLEGVAEHPGASNREVADCAGIVDQGQVSKLLARLHGLGLLANGGLGHTKGEPNAWTLTVKGERVAQSIRAHRAHHPSASEEEMFR